MERRLVEVFYAHNRCFMPTSVCCGRANSSPQVDDECRARLPRCWLRRYRANGTGDAQPVGEVGKGLRQVQHDAPHGTLDPDAKLQEPLTQGADLGSRTLAAAGAQAQLLHQNVGGGGEQYPQLIGEKARAAGAVDLKAVVQLFYPVLD